MPIYAYRCAACGHAKDVLQKMSDAVLTECPACGASSFVKQVTAAGFQLKGSGWYVTDFKGGAAAAAASADGAKGDAKQGDAKQGDAKQGEAPKSDAAKPDATSAPGAKSTPPADMPAAAARVATPSGAAPAAGGG